MHEAFERLGEARLAGEAAGGASAAGGDAPLAEQSLLQYFAASGCSSRVLDLADAIYANDYGAVASDVARLRVDFREELIPELAS